jgi:hypothetical protein
MFFKMLKCLLRRSCLQDGIAAALDDYPNQRQDCIIVLYDQNPFQNVALQAEPERAGEHDQQPESAKGTLPCALIRLPKIIVLTIMENDYEEG